jgi:hypothetical protein
LSHDRVVGEAADRPLDHGVDPAASDAVDAAGAPETIIRSPDNVAHDPPTVAFRSDSVRSDAYTVEEHLVELHFACDVTSGRT